MTDAVVRECVEELGITVAVKDLAFVIEGMYGEPFHRVDLVFLCEYQSDIQHTQLHSDTNQIGTEWLAIDGLENQPLYPSKLRKAITDLYHTRQTAVYLGNESMGS